jgi:hypothetical protein
VPREASAERRRDERRSQIGRSFGETDLDAALDVLALMDLAWHDCYGESCPPETVIDDVLTIARGDLAALVRAAHLAVVDFRDARVAADAIRDTGAS